MTDEIDMIDEMEKLREHLKCFYPIFDRFCENFGFQYANPTSIGRYPRIRVTQQSLNVQLAIDLWMEYDSEGKRFIKFDPSLPYELSGGASVHFEDGTEHGYRYSRSFVKYLQRPFHKVESSLYEDLTGILDVLKKWNIGDILREGKKIKLGSK